MKSEVSERISGLRKDLGFGQEEFANVLGTNQGTVSRWEAGRSRPSPEMFVRLAKLADGVQKFFFLDQAGVPESFFEGRPMPPEIAHAAAQVVARAIPGPSVVAASFTGIGLQEVRVLKDAAAAGTPRAIEERNIELRLPLPLSWFPRGSDIFGLHVAGDSMSPILENGYLAFVNVAYQDPEGLIGQIVAAREGDGITIKWLRKDNDSYVLVPENLCPRHPVRVVRAGSDFKIIGGVVCWLGKLGFRRR